MIGIQHRAATTAFRFFLFGVLACIAACSGGGGGGGSSSSGPVVAPVIVVQPQSQTVADGQPVTFSVAATGTSLTYQWSRNGAAIAGATAATYTIPAVQLSDTGSTFTVAVSNAAGSVQSATATLTVNLAPPTITNNTARTISVTAGSTATLTVTATGSAPLTFQWRRGGAPIAGATSASYTTPATTFADNGATFDVVVTNAAGTATSALYTLAVTTSAVAPGIGTQPQSATVRAGDPVTFSVTATGTAPLTYQWLRDGTAIAGAQSPTFTLSSTQLTDNAAQLTVTVTNAGGSVTSSPATLTVIPQPGIALLAGDVGGVGFLDGPGSTARLTSPVAVTLDSAGNAYFTDGSTVRRLGTDGAVVTVAGSSTQTGAADGGALTAARFTLPSGITTDPSGNLYVSDSSVNTIRRITPAGVVSTIAGTANTAGSSDGTGAAALFSNPIGLASDAAGNVYIADVANQTIRKMTPAGAVTTLAGSPGAAGAADGTGAAARFNSPRNLALDASGNVYVTDFANHTIRKITPAGVVTTIAGQAGVSGTTDGTGAGALFNAPSGISVDAAGNAYVTELGSPDVRKVTPAGVVTRIAGSTTSPGSFADGTGGAARFALPSSVASDASGTLYVADTNNFAIRKVSTTAVVSTVAGAPILQGTTDATGSAARFNVPFGIAVDGAFNTYVSDNFNHTIRKITVTGVVTTLAGQAGTAGAADGAGAAARFRMPQGVAVDAAGTVYVADRDNHTIRKVTPAGVVTTLAGQPGVQGAADGTGAAATFRSPAGIVVDAAGNVYVTDNNPTIRKITPAGVVTTLAGAAGRIGAVDGPGNVASFGFPQQLTIDPAGNLYVADAGNAIIRKVTPSGVTSTVAGLAGAIGSTDGPAASARFGLPTGIAIDRAGNLYVSDVNTHSIRKIDTAGNVTTPVGVSDGVRGARLGAFPGHLDLPVELAIDPNGTLYTTDVNGILRIAFP